MKIKAALSNCAAAPFEITEVEWAAFMDDLQRTMNKFDVPPPEQQELKAIIESTHDAIVVSPLQSATA